MTTITPLLRPRNTAILDPIGAGAGWPLSADALATWEEVADELDRIWKVMVGRQKAMLDADTDDWLDLGVEQIRVRVTYLPAMLAEEFPDWEGGPDRDRVRTILARIVGEEGGRKFGVIVKELRAPATLSLVA